MKEIEKLQQQTNQLKPEHQSDAHTLIATNEALEKRINRLERKLIREKAARKEAELIMETKSLELYDLNLKLIDINQTLEETVAKRTQELRENLDKVEIINTELMDIAYVVSHDVRGSVRQIGGLVSLIDEEYREDNLNKGDLMDYISEIKNRTFKMYHLLDGIRDYISIGRKFHETSEVDLQHNVSQIISQSKLPKGFQINIINKLPVININPDRSYQIFNHIIQNAIEYHHDPSHAVVNIHCEYDENYFEINIKDNGPGIAPRYHDRIFKLFQLLDSNQKGKGIGLPIVKKMLEAINGKIRVESKEGKGASFKILFPNELLVH